MDVLISFDTTGSMYPCLSEVRTRVSELVNRLFTELPEVRVAIIAHGDYCDARSTYVTKRLDFSTNKETLTNFVKTVSSTGGGDSNECYELVLHEAQELNWASDKRAFLLIGDDEPHPVSYALNKLGLDWKVEASKLGEMGVQIYSVQCLNVMRANHFYQTVAKLTDGYMLNLHQFSNAVELILAVFYQQMGKLEQYQEELETSLKFNRGLAGIFAALGSTRSADEKYTTVKEGLQPVHPTRFQVLSVPFTTDIKSFVESTGAIFRKGKGFYQFTKSELIQENKEVVLRNRVTGDMFTGAEARNMIGLPYGSRGNVRPKFLEGYEVFVQSTSNNRKLLGNTKFLYESI